MLHRGVRDCPEVVHRSRDTNQEKCRKPRAKLRPITPNRIDNPATIAIPSETGTRIGAKSTAFEAA